MHKNPILPPVLEGERATLTQKQFKDMARMIAFAAHDDETRPWFTGILWEIERKHVRWVATDTHRLALLVGEFKDSTFMGSHKAILSAQTIMDVSRLLDNQDNKEITMVFGSRQVFIHTDKMRVITRIIEGQYPKYEQVIPQEYKTRLTMSRQELLDAIERASIITLSHEKTKVIKTNCTNNLFTISGHAPEVGHIYEEVATQIDGEPIPIAFNYSYLRDGLRVMNSVDVNVDLIGTLSAFVIKPIDDTVQFLYLVVPVRAA